MRRTTRRALRHSEVNASDTHEEQHFVLWLRCKETARPPSVEQRRFSAGDRRFGLCVVASPDGRAGSVRLRSDVCVYSALLDPGQHIAHELRPGRAAWLHVVEGAVNVGDLRLARGDGVGVRATRALSLTARDSCEVLLVDLLAP